MFRFCFHFVTDRNEITCLINSTVLGSYAHFMWEADEDDEDEEVESERVAAGATMVAAY